MDEVLFLETVETRALTREEIERLNREIFDSHPPVLTTNFEGNI